MLFTSMGFVFFCIAPIPIYHPGGNNRHPCILKGRKKSMKSTLRKRKVEIGSRKGRKGFVG